MSQEMVLSVGREALVLMILASLPPIGASLVVGFLVSLFQASTQLQESSLAVVPKLCAAVLSLVVTAPWISAQLTRFALRLLLLLPHVQAAG